MSEKKAWKCPVCHIGVAPHMDTCPACRPPLNAIGIALAPPDPAPKSAWGNPTMTTDDNGVRWLSFEFSPPLTGANYAIDIGSNITGTQAKLIMQSIGNELKKNGGKTLL